MYEDLDIPQNFREELLPLLESLIQFQNEVVAIASGFKKDSFYFIPTLLTLPSSCYTGSALRAFANRCVDDFIKLIVEAGRGEHYLNDECKTTVDQLRFVIDYDYDTVRGNLEDIKRAVEVGSEDELKERQERYRAEAMERREKEFPALAQARRSQMH